MRDLRKKPWPSSKKFIRLLLGICLGSAPLHSQSREIQGVVKDSQSGERLPNATLIIKGSPIGTKSNLEGFFDLPTVPDSTFVIQARYVGYSIGEFTVDRYDKSEYIVIELTPQDIQVPGVTVTGEVPAIMKQENTPGLSTVSPRQLATLPNAGQPDIFRSMQLLPGVSGTNDRSSGLNVLGGTPDENLVLFDGMTVYHVDHFFGFFSAFNPDAVKDVQFYEGGFPAMYGGRLSSVIDMSGKSGDPSNFHAGAGLNLLSGNAIVEVPLFDRGSFLIAARRSYSDIISTGAYTSLTDLLTGSSSSTRAPRGFGGGRAGQRFGGFSSQVTPTPMFYDLNSKLTYNLTPDDIVSASLYNSLDDLNQSQQAGTQGLANSTFAVNLPSMVDDTRQENVGGSLKWFHQWSGRFYSNLVVSSDKYTSAYHYQIDRSNPNSTIQNAQSTEEDNSINDMTLRLDNQLTLAGDNNISFGTQISRTNATYSLSANTIFNQSLNRILGLNQQSTEAAVYAQDRWEIIPPLEITAGLRATDYTLTNQYFLEPRFSWRYALTTEFSVKGAYGIYHQFSNRIINQDLTEGSRDFWILADDQIPPGIADHYIVGGAWEDQDYLVNIDAYYKVLNNLVEFSQRYRNAADDLYAFYIGSGTAKGIVVLLQKKIGALNGWISYTLGRAEDVFPALNDGNPFPAEQDQTHELKIVGNLSLGDNWTVASTFIYGSGTPYTTPISQYTITLLDSTTYQYTHVSAMDAYRLPPYQRLDLSVSKRFGDENSSHWIVGLSAFNLLNYTNIAYYQYDLTSNPIHITEVKGLGLTPTVFVQVDFQ